jgi:indolepyruvate ferredoxin oxidoreductase alpha subunit
VYPLVPEPDRALSAAGTRAVLVIEEGQPDFIEQDIATLLRRADLSNPAARQGPAHAWAANTRPR